MRWSVNSLEPKNRPFVGCKVTQIIVGSPRIKSVVGTDVNSVVSSPGHDTCSVPRGNSPWETDVSDAIVDVNVISAGECLWLKQRGDPPSTRPGGCRRIPSYA